MIRKLREFLEGSRGSVRVRGVVLVTAAAMVVGLALMATLLWTGGDSASATHRQGTPTDTPTITNTPTPTNTPTVTDTPTATATPQKILAGHYANTASSASNSTGPKTVNVFCNSTDLAIGGGAELTGTIALVAVQGSFPIQSNQTPPANKSSATAVGWRAEADEMAAQAGNWALNVYVICAIVKQP